MALRIAHLIESDGPGGAERMVADLAAACQEHGDVNVVFLPMHGEGWLGQQLHGSGVVEEHFRLDRPVSPQCVRALVSAFHRHRIDVAHSHEFSMAVYGGCAAWLAGIPHVITMHGSRYYAGRLQRRLALRAAISRSGSTIAVSHQLASHLANDLRVRGDRIGMIPNGVRPVAPPPRATSLREELGLTPEDRLIIAIGNLYPVKGHRYLVDAVALLASRHPRLHVAIAGRGDQAGALVDRAQSHRIADRVHLLGLRSDVGSVLAAADGFVLPSLSEGLPLALLEAMFAGRPIVATRVGEVASALDNGEAGILVAPGDALALGAGIDVLLTNPGLARALAEQARRRAEAEYGIAQMVDRYRGVYAQLAAGARASFVRPAA